MTDKKEKRDKRKSEAHEKPQKKQKQQDASEYLKEHNISIEDPKGKSWKPLPGFDESGLDKKILYATRGFDKPTPIQSVCWPILMKDRDIIGIAQTGSGKTLGFGIRALERISNAEKRAKPSVLILSPTRELASQIHEQMDKAGKKLGVTSTVLYGGVDKRTQKDTIRAGVDIIVACPGRLLDLMEEGAVKLSKVDYVVLDEADRMLDLGFEKEVRKILSTTRTDRQTAMFSATWPTSIQKLASEFLSSPVKVTVGSEDLNANVNIKQLVEVLDPRDKDATLLKLLNKYHSSRKNKIVIFGLYKKETARLEHYLQSRGWNCVAIHGDMKQHERTANFEKFRSGAVPLLIATDVAARGLDIPCVEYVINYTFPLTIEDYVHRIGRTGRAGMKGTSHTFFTALDKSRSGELINVLKQANQEVPENLMAFGTTVKKKEHSVYGAFYKEVDPNIKGTKITFGSDDES